MKKVAFYIVLLLSALLIWLPQQNTVTFKNENILLKTKDSEFMLEVELALTPRQQELGLMHRTRMADNHGMLFVFDPPKNISMWMKDTKLPLDMFFIDERGSIVYIAENAEPESTRTISSNREIKAVLELKGASAQSKKIAIGDRVVAPFFIHE